MLRIRRRFSSQETPLALPILVQIRRELGHVLEPATCSGVRPFGSGGTRHLVATGTSRRPWSRFFLQHSFLTLEHQLIFLRVPYKPLLHFIRIQRLIPLQLRFPHFHLFPQFFPGRIHFLSSDIHLLHSFMVLQIELLQ